MSIKTKIGSLAANVALKGSKRAPEILVISGMIGMAGATIWAIKSTFEASKTIAVRDELLIQNEEKVESEEFDYTEEDAIEDAHKLNRWFALEMIKYYAGPFILLAAGGAAILYGHHKRYVGYLGMAAMAAAAEADYKGLVDRIRAEYGDEIADKLKYDIHEVVEEYEEEQEDGSVVSGTRAYDTSGNIPSLYARVFDETCTEWRKDPIHNMMFLRKVQEEANRTLHNRGFITLNEVYAALGLPLNDDYGNEAGWTMKGGDDFVDFGLYDEADDNPRKRAFINGYVRNVLLDFNCVGRIRAYA